ncbi:MAG: chemotaxis protein CheA [Desulfotomaculaceae bacterium]|nr:chemotaxis protein CheA [Desulfotomaculaceae bacterium]
MAYGDFEEKLEMVKCFLHDSREMLDAVEPQIIAMEEKALTVGEIDEAILNAIFRLFHSLKGSAAFLDLQTIISVTHEAETLLDIFRSGQAVIEPTHVDLLIRTTDFIRNILDVVEQQLNDEGYEESATGIIADLKKTIVNVLEEQEPAAEGQPAPRLPEEETAVAAEAGEFIAPANNIDLGMDITPEILKRFAEESNELLDEVESTLLALEKAPGDLESATAACRALHSLKGNAGFLGYPDMEEISRCGENLLGQIKEQKKNCDPVVVSFLLIAIDILREGVRQVEAGCEPELPGKQEVCAYLEKLAAEGSSQKERGNEEKSNKANKETVATGEAKAEVKEKQTGAGGGQAIRVDLDKLDKLLDLVGELVISEAMVANNPDLKGLQLDRFEKAVLQLDKITRDIQEVAMSMRMIPLSGTFRKMKRLVRDLAHKAGKKVSLEIIGEETEVDKTIIEQISDPLVHLIRNAVDHGLEGAAERLAAGKPETGRVTLEARHSAGEVWIIVEDDGRGLDREKIIKKGIEKDLISSEDHEMKDEKIWKMIFEPGFSTTEQISNISGRGVGMDVVKRNIEKLRGKVDVRSRPGAGAVFAVRIPLTLAIIEGMVVKVGASRYIIPINSIKESLQPKAGQITRTPGGLEIVSIRDELLPVIRLHDLYQVKTNCLDLGEGILTVVENDEKKCCLFVDEVIGQQQIVIKGLSSYLGHVQSISGCAILGDGDISMILDIDDLIMSAEQVKR